MRKKRIDEVKFNTRRARVQSYNPEVNDALYNSISKTCFLSKLLVKEVICLALDKILEFSLSDPFEDGDERWFNLEDKVLFHSFISQEITRPDSFHKNNTPVCIKKGRRVRVAVTKSWSNRLFEKYNAVETENNKAPDTEPVGRPAYSTTEKKCTK